MSAVPRVVAQGEILQGGSDPPSLVLPDRSSVFADRAARFRTLASRTPATGDYLLLLACLAEAQQAALATHPDEPPPRPERLELSRQHGLPVLGKSDRPGAAWRDALNAVLAYDYAGAPEPVRRVIARLQAAPAAEVDAFAADLLDLNYPNLDPAAVPFVAAALQVHWVHRATALGAAAFGKLDVPNVCPVCGSPPVASRLRIDVAAPGSRYLHCSLCDAEWYFPRGQCTQCDSREKVAYLHVEGGGEAVKAEACDECHGYLKILNAEKDPLADPVADDLASLALDVVLDESGYERAGPNLFFVPGQA